MAQYQLVEFCQELRFYTVEADSLVEAVATHERGEYNACYDSAETQELKLVSASEEE